MNGRIGMGAVLAAILAAAVWAPYGFDGSLLRDDAIYLYAARSLLEGVAPYESIFDHKGPGAARMGDAVIG